MPLKHASSPSGPETSPSSSGSVSQKKAEISWWLQVDFAFGSAVGSYEELEGCKKSMQCNVGFGTKENHGVGRSQDLPDAN
jgi:hypothetical protein